MELPNRRTVALSNRSVRACKLSSQLISFSLAPEPSECTAATREKAYTNHRVQN